MNKVELQPLYLAQSFTDKIPVVEVLWRYDISGSRNYRRKNGDTFRSLTTFIGLVESNPIHLQTWRENLIEDLGSGDKVDTFVQATAEFGTGLHEALAIIVREGGVDWEQMTGWTKNELSNAGLTGKTLSSAVTELRSDIACFMQFLCDYNVKVLAVELPVWSPDGYATLVDLVCEKDEKKYENTPVEKRKRHKCIINLKSGKKGFFESHSLQLEGERRAFNHVYGTSFGEINAVYNLAPTAWKTTPDYKLKDQTKDLEADNRRLIRMFDNYLDRAKIEGVLGTPKLVFKVFKGITKVGESPVNQLFFQEYGQFVEDDKNFETTKDINSEK